MTAPGEPSEVQTAPAPQLDDAVKAEDDKENMKAQTEAETKDDAAKSPPKCPRPYLEIDTGAEESPNPRLVSPSSGKISLDITPLSCKSTKSTDSSAEYHQPDQTIIIFDWDDTLCPSTTCMKLHGLSVLGEPPTGPVAAALEELTRNVKELVEKACELSSQVVVVTNAEEGWVDLSCKAWLPGLQDTISKCDVVSARSTWEPRGIQSPAGWKARAFEDVVDRFYSRYDHQSWKNIISIGDAPHEREALSRVIRWAPAQKNKIRSKSIKFVLRPTVEQLIREIQMLQDSMRDIVWHDDDLDLFFSADSLTDPAV